MEYLEKPVGDVRVMIQLQEVQLELEEVQGVEVDFLEVVPREEGVQVHPVT